MARVGASRVGCLAGGGVMALTGAQRSRLHRARRREGLAVLPIPVDLRRLLNTLMDDGRIGEDCQEERVIDAVADIIDDYIKIETRSARRRSSRGIF